MTKCSIIIPTYNRAHCIARAVESVRAQGVRDLEVLIGDDASTDGTVDLARRVFPDLLAARLERNSGAAAARNAALRVARGEFLAFLDSDDEWLPGKLGAQLAFLESHPEVAACATSHVFCRRDGVRRDVVVENAGDWSRRLQAGQPFHGASTPVVRRAVLESVGLQDESLRVLEDWDWMLRIAQRHTIHVLPEPLAVIHENGPSDADQTLISTKRFLEKHDGAFLEFGAGHRRELVSQHWENAARSFFRHGRNREGMGCLAKALAVAPRRNPALTAAFPLACVDAALGTRLLRRVLRARGGYSIL
jgi:glycosyltransferase involved in cell wall biosynthesis